MYKKSGVHLTEADRQIIFTGIINGSTKAAIAKLLGKDKSTIGKEIKLHRTQVYYCRFTMECMNYPKCKLGRHCSKSCEDFKPFKCTKRDRSPGTCDGCSIFRRCVFNKYKYQPNKAHAEYRTLLTDCREGFNITNDEIIRIGNIIQPLIKKGQSVESILFQHPEINLSVQTIYTYIESRVFLVNGIDLGPMDLRRQVKRKITKDKHNYLKKREDRAYLKNRTYKDFKLLLENDEDLEIVEMDTVYNNPNGPILQTFLFVKYSFLFAFLHKEKTAETMNNGVLLLEEILSEQQFQEHAKVILTDRGGEFIHLPQLEIKPTGEKRCSFFYCDPMCSSQKPHVENKHEELRYILPKGVDLEKLGLLTQDDLNIVLTQINSSPRKKLAGKSPLEVMSFYQPMLAERFELFGIHQIPKDEIILRPTLLNKNRK